MTVLTQALQRLDRKAGCVVPPGVGFADSPGATEQRLVQPPTVFFVARTDFGGACSPPDDRLPVTVRSDDRNARGDHSLGHEEADLAEQPVFLSLPEVGRGQLLHACDLTVHSDQGLALAMGLLAGARAEESEPTAVVTVVRREAAVDPIVDSRGERFTETNQPGVFVRRLMLDESGPACRELLVLIDECRRRFSRTVLVVDGADALAMRLVAPRVDETLLLATQGGTPESALLRAESRLRTHAPLVNRRTLIAA